jgi:Lon protease-like protein
MEMTTTIPLFPLKAVLFPGGFLPLRVFEPRYLDMVSDCLKKDIGIGVVLITEGSETGNAANTHEIGTVAGINYWHKRPDGLLGVTLLGEKRFKILKRDVQPSQLILAEVEWLAEANEQSIDDEHRLLVDLLQQIISQLDPPFTKFKPNYESANWVSARLVELLPLALAEKQKLLMMNDIEQRMKDITRLLHKLDIL